MSTKVKLTILGFLVLVVGFLSLWQIIASFEALQKKVGQAEEVNVRQLKDALIFWEEREPFVFEEATKATEKIEKTPVEKKLKVEILNGSGIPKAAAGLKEKLEKELKEIEVVTLGNTEATSTSILSVKKQVPENTQTAILEIIKTGFPTVEQKTLFPEAEVEILIILGK